jgi:hypothetical protein
MKCIKCNIDNTLIDRNINMGRCKKCEHQFVFAPISMSAETRITDVFFAELIKNLSVDNTLFFTSQQLYYSLEKQLRSRARKGISTYLFDYTWGGILFISPVSIMGKGFFKLSFNQTLPIIATIYLSWAIWEISQNSISSELTRRNRKNSIDTLKLIAIAIIIIGLPLSILKKTVVGIVSSIVLSVCAILLVRDRQNQQDNIFDDILIDREQFDTWLNRWNSINDSPEKILSPPQTSNLPAAPNPEITAYSFDRAVICDTPEIAQLLISNNFHFENNCAILTIDGYPQSIFTTTMEMLRRNPDLKVYALHNCSPSGIQIVHRLRTDHNWFPDPTIPIIDVGILPRQIMDNLDLLILQSPKSAQASQQLDPDFRASLNPAALAWLDAGCYLELESFSPRKLIQILQRAISESLELAIVDDDEMLAMNNHGYYTVENFG